jgi:hypothetical protein
MTREQARRWTCAVVAHAFLSLGAAMPAAALEPLPKNGSCPFNYIASGNYCVPSPGARPTIPKLGSCPVNYVASGNYCIAGQFAPSAIPKAGTCPVGYVESGNYCVKPN